MLYAVVVQGGIAVLRWQALKQTLWKFKTLISVFPSLWVFRCNRQVPGASEMIWRQWLQELFWAYKRNSWKLKHRCSTFTALRAGPFLVCTDPHRLFGQRQDYHAQQCAESESWPANSNCGKWSKTNISQDRLRQSPEVQQIFDQPSLRVRLSEQFHPDQKLLSNEFKINLEPCIPAHPWVLSASPIIPKAWIGLLPNLKMLWFLISSMTEGDAIWVTAASNNAVWEYWYR